MIYKTRKNSSSGGYVESSKKIANIQSCLLSDSFKDSSIGCKKKKGQIQE